MHIGLSIGMRTPSRISGVVSIYQQIANLYSSGEQGAWYDPSDVDRYMAEKGLELLTNGDFSNGTTGWLMSTGATVVAGQLRLLGVSTAGLGDGSSSTRASPSIISNGKVCTVEFDAQWVSGAANLTAGQLYVNNKIITPAENGGVMHRYSYTTTVEQVTPAFAIPATSGEWLIDNVSVREVTGVSTATLFQDNAGATPVTAVEQPVGLMLDKRLGLVLGADNLTGGGTFDSATGWTVGSGWTISGGKANFAPTGSISLLERPTTGLVVGKYYKVVFTISNYVAGSLTVRLGNNTLNSIIPTTANNSFSYVFQIANNATNSISLAAGTTFNGSVDDFIVQLLDGNHATQATAAARPTLSARVNLLTKVEQFDDAAWTKQGTATITANTQASPDGSTTADTYTSTTAANAIVGTTNNLSVNTTYTASLHIKQGTARWVMFSLYDGSNGCRFWVDTQLAAKGATAVIGTGPALLTFDVESLANGWARVKVAFTSPAAISYFQFTAVDSNSSTTPVAGTIYLWGAQLETGAVATTYQRVNTATDYDTVGFPKYAKTDGIDDSMSTTAGGGGTAGFFWCGAVMPLGGAGGARAIWGDNGSNTGYFLHLDATGVVTIWVGIGGSLVVLASGATTVAVGEKKLITVWDDGVNLNMQIGAGAITQITRPIAVAGTAGFTIGKLNGTAAYYFNGNIYPFVYRTGTPLTPAQITSAQTYCKAKAGL